jgi:predicted transcriptional regulator
MPETPIKVPLDDETLRRLRELATTERRGTSDQASILLSRALARRERRNRVLSPDAPR